MPEAWLGLGIVSDLEGNTVEGIKLIQKAIDLEATNGSFYHVLAGAYEKQENWEEAENAYITSLLLDNTNEESVTDYMEMLIEQNKINQAKEFLASFEHTEDLKMIVELSKVNLLWLSEQRQPAIDILIECIAQDEEKSKEIFSLNPLLKNEPIIVNLFTKL